MSIEEIIFIYKSQPHLTVKEMSKRINKSPEEIRKVIKDYYIRDEDLSAVTKFICILLNKKGNTPQNRQIIAKKLNMTPVGVRKTFNAVKGKVKLPGRGIDG